MNVVLLFACLLVGYLVGAVIIYFGSALTKYKNLEEFDIELFAIFWPLSAPIACITCSFAFARDRLSNFRSKLINYSENLHKPKVIEKSVESKELGYRETECKSCGQKIS